MVVVASHQASQERGVSGHAPRPATEPMEVEESAKVEDDGEERMSQSDDGGRSDSDSDDMGDANHPVPPLNIQRPLGGRGNLIGGHGHLIGGRGHLGGGPGHLGGGRGHLGGGRGFIGGGGGHMINPFNREDETFSGRGHRLGGKDPIAFSKPSKIAEAAAVQREGVVASGPAPSHTPSPLSLETLCTRVLVSHSSKYGMPSCAGLSPLLAQRLMAALKQDKKLNSKTLMAFYKWSANTLVVVVVVVVVVSSLSGASE